MQTDRIESSSGFTLVESLVSAALLFVILSIVYLTAALASKIFERERVSFVVDFDSYGYLMSLDRLFGRATHVREIRDEKGFFVQTLDFENSTGEEIVHVIKKGFIYIQIDKYKWSGNIFFEDGLAKILNRQIISTKKKKIKLNNVLSIDMKIVNKDKNFRVGDLQVFEVKIVQSGNKTYLKKIPIGGHYMLTSKDKYIFHGTVEE